MAWGRKWEAKLPAKIDRRHNFSVAAGADAADGVADAVDGATSTARIHSTASSTVVGQEVAFQPATVSSVTLRPQSSSEDGHVSKQQKFPAFQPRV